MPLRRRTPPEQPGVRRLLVATDRSQTAERAVAWAASWPGAMRPSSSSLQVIPPDRRRGASRRAEASLRELARELAGDAEAPARVIHPRPGRAIVDAATTEGADVLVVGNAGMSGRKEFLLGNVPNRISHDARCTVVIVNTTDGGRGRGPSRSDGARTPAGLLAARRTIARVVARFGLAERAAARVATGGPRAAAARGARGARARPSPSSARSSPRGPTCSRPSSSRSSRSCRTTSPPLTEAEVVAVMEQELQVPWEDVFETHRPRRRSRPGRSARCIARTLENGDRVVVKVQRPTAREEILRDLGLLELFAEKARERPALRGARRHPGARRHLSDSLRRELDFRQEAENIERMREVLEPYTGSTSRALYRELSTSRLLVMEEIEGVPLRTRRDGAERARGRASAARGLLPRRCYRRLLPRRPAPGKPALVPTGRIYFLDLGMVGEVGRRACASSCCSCCSRSGARTRSSSPRSC